MKTNTQLALTGLATVLFATGSAFAGNSEVRTIDNHHGTVTYLPRETSQKSVTIALYNQRGGSGVGQVNRQARRDQGTFRQVATPHGTVSYYAPAE
ncbi:MAG TPA: hypothetical protein VK961_20935 [Chthoniobacter sp.]|nr:hypothetical protein [Chthoniobacter sp.]